MPGGIHAKLCDAFIVFAVVEQWFIQQRHKLKSVFSARCNIYDVSVRLSVRLSMTEVHWRIIANLGFKFRSKVTAYCGRSPQCAAVSAGKRVGVISRYASHC